MNISNPSRRAPASPDVAAGVRPGAGVLGLAKADSASGPESSPTPEGTLLVGEGIHVRGEIESCNTLIVEGKVEASLEAAVLTVRKGGVFNGKAEVETATVAGVVDGDLTVKGLLTIESGGRVSGTLRYSELKIAQGGRLSGDIDLLDAGEATSSEAASVKARVVEGARANG